MFIETFIPEVINQFKLRQMYNSVSGSDIQLQLGQNIKGYQDWASRTPFVLAYSNVRYGTSSIAEDKRHSVLGSIHFDTDDLFKNKIGFYDLYDKQNQETFGITPRPLIKSLDITPKGGGGLLKDVKLVIQCFNFQQFYNVRRYFSIPGTSIFLQFGDYVSKKDISERLVMPLQTNGVDQMPNVDPKETYLDQPWVYDRIAGSTHIDMFDGAIVGFDIAQTGTRFVLTLDIRAKGASQMMNYYVPSFSGKNLSKDKSPSIVTNCIAWAQKKPYTDQGQCIVLNSDKDTYVTIDWLFHLPLLFMRDDIANTGPEEWYPPIIQKPFICISPQFFKQQLISNNKDVIMVNDSNKELLKDHPKLKTFNTTFKDVKDKYQFYANNAFDTIKSGAPKIGDSYMNNMQEITYKQAIKKIQIFHTVETIGPKQKQEDKFSINNSVYDKPIGHFGNVYIRLNKVLQLLKDTQKMSVDVFVQQIIQMVNHSFSGKISLTKYVDNNKQIININSFGFRPITSKDPFVIQNFGYNSIVKDINYTFKIQSGYNLAIYSVYGDNPSVVKGMYNSMFGDCRFIDIKSRYKIDDVKKNQTTNDTGDKQAQTQTAINMLTRNQINTKITNVKEKINSIYIKSSKMIDVKKLEEQTMVKNINQHNILQDALHNIDLAGVGKQKSISSAYATQVQITLDFIANILHYQTFMLSLNPLGSNSKFHVIAIKHRVDDDKAQTTITGQMYA